MIEQMLILKPAISLLHAEGVLGDLQPLNLQDWDNLLQISLVLKPFKDAQKLLEGR